MDFSNPVCRRTRSKTEEFYRTLSKPRKRERGSSSNVSPGASTEIQIKVENEDLGSDSGVVFVDEDDAGVGLESRKVASQSQDDFMEKNGTRDNPCCIDEDDDDDEDDDEHKCNSDSEFLLSSEDNDDDGDDSDDSSDCPYDIDEDKEERHWRKRRKNRDFEMTGESGELLRGVWRRTGSGERYGEFRSEKKSSNENDWCELTGKVFERRKENEKVPSGETSLSGSDVEGYGVSEESFSGLKEANGGKSAQKSCSVAKRTGLGSYSRPAKEKVGDGTVLQPFCIDENSDDGVVDYEDDLEEEIPEVLSVNKKQVFRKRWRSAKSGEKNLDVTGILLDSITERTTLQVPHGNETPVGDDNLPPNEKYEKLPLKFFFGDEPKKIEKSACELELDQLWDELNLGLAAGEIGSWPGDMEEDEDVLSSERDMESLCSRGKHQWILDEQIGVVCTRCLHVHEEIRHILPSFEKNPWGHSDSRDLGPRNCSIFDKLGQKDYNCDSHYGNGFSDHAETVWDFIPGIKETMYPHQQEGFEFIWKKIAGGIHLEDLKDRSMENSSGEGCIISHAPGTGKSRLTIVFLQSYMKLYPKCLPVIIAPRSMLLTWEEEFRKWKVDIPFHNFNSLDLSGKEDEVAAHFLRKSRHDHEAIRAVKLLSWAKGGAILGISYRLFEKRATQVNDRAKQVAEILLNRPSLVVLDEGHTPRNSQSLIWQALSRLKTMKRIALSGTPFQNNFDELFNTFRLVNPKFRDGDSLTMHNSDKEARKEWSSLTKSVEKMDNISEELRSIIDSVVHRHEGNVLDSLPGLKDSLVILKPSPLQKNLLQVIHESIKSQFILDREECLVSIHPSLFLKTETPVPQTVDKDELDRLKLNHRAGVKTEFLVELIRLCVSVNEKVLVFSQYLDPLSLVMEQLKSHFSWSQNAEIFYMDGKMDIKQRQSSINAFNNPSSKVRVLLASTRACAEGINLVGASRVVLLDLLWNPAVERQAISRAFRLGQKKFVYIYRLITSGTKEKDKYSRQAEKDRMSKLVFSSSNCDSNPQETQVKEDRILEEMVQHKKLKNMFEDTLIWRIKPVAFSTSGYDF
ncbi:SNF2 domain-containing protein CLASSY 4-like [Humulus lupulus]|uniref:SNF2 domain-containing protein CLASSY 4-like n=1 Tax=Humulus lupulus TaxID=3486 RepID=UPI002B40F854|nr:SNF2 domain-containing protein CLASSY 4-like [Humulus lupulus]